MEQKPDIKTDRITINGKEYKLVPVEPEKKPFPQVGDRYRYITANGAINADTFLESTLGAGRLAIGNMYQTEQQAENALRAKKLIKTINDAGRSLTAIGWRIGRKVRV